MSIYKDITRNGLWKQNTILAQLLGLCPLLAVSTNLVNAVSLGLATITRHDACRTSQFPRCAP